MKPNHGMLFKTYLEALLSGRSDRVAQVLELVEAHYGPRVQDDKDKIKTEKEKLQKIDSELKEL